MAEEESGSIDAFLDAVEAAPEANAPEQPAPPTEPSPAPEEEAPADATSGPPEIPDELRPYVKELRDESAKYRTALKPYKEAFDGYPQEEVELLLNIVNGFKVDRDSAAQQMRDLAFALLSDETGAPTEAWEKGAPWIREATDVGGTDNQDGTVSLTQEQIDEIVQKRIDEQFNQRSQQAQQEQYLAQLRTDAQALGYEPNSALYEALLTEMVNSEVDMETAHKNLVAQYQEKFGNGEAPPREFPKPPQNVGGGQAQEPTEAPKTIKEASAQFSSWLDSQGM